MPTRRELLVAAVTLPLHAHAEEADIARRLADLYPVNASLGYVTALIWSAQRQLTGGQLPPRSAQALLALRQVAPATPLTEWPLRAGYAAFAEAARHDGDAAAGELALQAIRGAIVDTSDGPRLAGLRPWTDDLFMATLLFDRTLPLLPAAEHARATEALGSSLLELTERLQRRDGLFDHAVGSPVAWGRGNGFAALGLAMALAGPLPAHAQLLSRLRLHLNRLVTLQGEDGLWRQVLDDATSRDELTVTAMSLAALAMARRHDWLQADAVDKAIARAWAGVRDRIDANGDFRGVCVGTPAGPTLDFYRQRPIVNGQDNRAAAMVLIAAGSLATCGAGSRLLRPKSY